MLLAKSELKRVSGIGANMTQHLINIDCPNSQIAKKAKARISLLEEIKDYAYQSDHIDRYVLYYYRLALYFINNDS